MNICVLRVLVAAAFLPLCLAAQAPDEFFERRIRPLLSKNCYPCHTGAESGGLRLDSRARLLQGGKSGPALVPGEPEKSLLLQAVAWQGKLKMPPSGKLAEQDLADLSTWIKDGAAW
ncbi:MAG TPA: c-type cytochrome domain-containing protein, partial [Tepidisphaeraceae bacterium]